MAYGTYTPYQQPTGYYQPRFDYPVVNNANQIATLPAGAQTPQNGFSCRPVTSREEALGVPAEFGCAGTIMPDLGHGMIYLKRLDMNTGLSNMYEFALQQPQKPSETLEISNVKYATLDDIEALRAEIEAIRKHSGKAAKKNDADE